MYWNLASSWEASQHGLLLAVSCRFRHSAWSCQNLEVTGLKAADALQKDLDIATGMVRVKLSNGPDILLSGTFFWWEMDMGYQILIQNCLMRLSDSVTDLLIWSSQHPVTLVLQLSLFSTKEIEAHTVNFYSLPKDRQTQLIRGRAGSWIRSVWLQELLTGTPGCLNTNRVSQSYGSDLWQSRL